MAAVPLAFPQRYQVNAIAEPEGEVHSVARPHASRVHVTLAEVDGWDIRVEINGCVVLTEHCSDWHRVERCQAALATDLARARARTFHPASAA